MPTPNTHTDAPQTQPARASRNPTIDIVRGIVMLLMALDHVRDYTIDGRATFTTFVAAGPALFFTRWITHFCAPTFVFLAGTAACLSGTRGRSRGAVSRFLWTRGLVLVLLEFTLVRFGWAFEFNYNMVVAQVIWALGMSMVALAALVYLPDGAILAFGLVLIAGHNAFDSVHLAHTGSTLVGASARDWLLAILHVQRPPVIYPLVPWLGVMAVGYVFGRTYAWPSAARRRLSYALGGLAIVLFVMLRALAVYGDPRPFDSAAAHPVLAFLDVAKYPPSLLYVLMTLGPMLIALAVLEDARGSVARALETIGKVPMFYYLAHIYLAHVVAVFLGMIQGYGAAEMCVPFFQLPKGYGVPLAGVYAIWVFVVAALYLPCRWFAAYKARSKQAWLRYV